MFGIGAQELILLMVAALIIFGPQRLPEIAAQVGKAIRDFRRMSDDLTGEFQRSFSLEEPPATETLLPAETIEANATPNGGTAIAEALRVETIPGDPEPVVEAAAESEATATAASETMSAPQDIVINLAPVATKADPLVGVSSLDEPAPYTGEKTSETPGSSTAPTESYETLSTTALAEGAPLALETAPSPGLDGTTNHVQNGIADAWDAVITTEATVAVAVAEPEAILTAPEGYAYPPNTASPAESASAESARPKIDPAAELTIREKIEAQVASEAFRERRRIASYQRARK
jgi:sec-independent protein translocase protein TatB